MSRLVRSAPMKRSPKKRSGMNRRPQILARSRVGASVARLLLLGLGLGLLLGCGEEPDTRTVAQLMEILDTGNDEQVDDAVQALAARAKADPKTVVPVLAEALRSYEGERYTHTFAFRIDGADPDRTALQALAGMLPNRLSDYGLGPGVFTVMDDHIRLQLPRPSLDEAAMARYIENVIFQMSARGTVALRLVVTDPDEKDEPKSLWKGDATSFNAYRDSEAKLLAEALKRDGAFEPTNPRYRTVLLRPGPGGGEASALVVYEPEDLTQAFDTADLKVRGGIDPKSKQAVVELSVEKIRWDHIEAWSKRHQGRAVALLLNGNAMHLTRLGDAIRERAMLPIGPADDPETIDWLKAFISGSQTGPYPARVKGELLPTKPEYLDLPIARALAHTGAPAEPALREIARSGTSVAPVARWALGEITRIATGQSKDQK